MFALTNKIALVTGSTSGIGHGIDIIESGYRSARTGMRQELETGFDLPPL